MSYHGVVNIIRTVAQAINPDGFFQHGRTWDASLNFDEGNPQIYLYPLQNSIDESNHYYETWSVVMGFFIQDTQDSSPAEREETIKNADILQRQFTTALNQIEGIEVSAIRTEPKYRQMAGTYSGVLLNFTLGATTNICGDEAEVVIIEPETLCDKIDTCLSIDRENGNEAAFLTNKGTFAEPDTETNWGEITGTLADQTDLQTALNGKSNTGHHHDERYYTESEVDAALTGKANSIHTHNLSDVTGLSSALNAKENSANKASSMSGNTTSNTVFLSAKAIYDWATSTFQNITTASSWGAFVNGLNVKTTVDDADNFTLIDSSASNIARQLSWNNLKAAIFSYVSAQVINPKNRSYYFDDCMGIPPQVQGSTITIQENQTTFVKGAGASLNRPSISGRPGVYQFSSNQNTLHWFYIRSQHNNVNDSNLISATCTWCINVEDLSENLKNFTTRVGWSGDTGLDPISGAYFRYSHNINGGRWQCVNRNSDNETVGDSGITVTAGEWYNLKVVLTFNEAKYYINDVLVQTITTNIPATFSCGFSYSLATSAFIVKRHSVDYFSWDIILNNSR